LSDFRESPLRLFDGKEELLFEERILGRHRK
jgi:hypothetical protein